jgi:hypothetical protein
MGFQRGRASPLVKGGDKTPPAKRLRLFSFAEYLAACCEDEGGENPP